jgi:ribosomal protein S18 acetylase RimI-like enzyme
MANRVHERRRRSPGLPVVTLSKRTEEELYARGSATLLASWEEYARGATGASLQRLPGVAAAIFPNEPERGVYNNALLERRLGARSRSDAVEVMETAYAAAGVDTFAAWVHESDRAMRDELGRRSYTLDTSTRAMGMSLDEISLPRLDVDLAPPSLREHLRIAGVPADFLAAADPAPFHILLGRLDGETVATALAFDLDGDCGIYNVGTLEHARRRGLASALTAIQLSDALARGCETASLQATPMAERLYAAAGFRDLGRILEYVPPAQVPRSVSPRRRGEGWGEAARGLALTPPGGGDD